MSDSDPTPSPRPRWESPGSDGSNGSWSGAYPAPRPVPYGSDPYAPAHAQPAAPPRPVFERADLWTTLLGTIAVLIVGVIATFIWVWIAPRAVAVKDAKGGVSLSVPETKAFVGADVTYFFITLGAGVLCALIAAIVARHRGLAVSIAMAGGGILSSLMVAWLGRWLSGGPLTRWADNASVGSHHLYVQLQTRPFVVAWPVAALLITFIVALATQDRPVVDSRVTRP